MPFCPKFWISTKFCVCVLRRCYVSIGYQSYPILLTLMPLCVTSKICGGVGIVRRCRNSHFIFLRGFPKLFLTISFRSFFVKYVFLNAFGGIGYTQHLYSEIFRLIDENSSLFSFAPIVKSVFLDSCCLSCRVSQLPNLQGFCRLVKMVWFSSS